MLPERIASKIDRSGECWRWTGCHSGRYGQVWFDGKMRMAHRVIWELLVGPIPEDHEIDHVTARGCRHKDCVRLKHLEPVTRRENLIRDQGRRGAFNREKTHCPAGHPHDDENTYITKTGRACRICQLEHKRAYRERQRAS